MKCSKRSFSAFRLKGLDPKAKGFATAIIKKWTLTLPGFLALGLFMPGLAKASCNDPMPSAIEQIPLPGHVFTPIPSRDGCWIFVSVTEPGRGLPSGIGVLHRDNGKIQLRRVAAIGGGHPTGLALTHDGQVLVATDRDQVVFFDTAKLTTDVLDPIIGRIRIAKDANTISLNITSNDHFLFVADEGMGSISVIDLAKARQSGFNHDSIVGEIPVGRGTISLTFSPDQRQLYSTSAIAPAKAAWPLSCEPEDRIKAELSTMKSSEGAILVIDVAKAETDPAHAVLATVPAGCAPVRLQISPGGERAYVTSRSANALLVFDTPKLTADPNHARIATVPVGSAPVGVAVLDHGMRIVVANSNHVKGAHQGHQTLTVIDASKVLKGSSAVIGSIPARSFPRELRSSSDGQTLFLTNYNSNTLEVMDLKRVFASSKK